MDTIKINLKEEQYFIFTLPEYLSFIVVDTIEIGFMPIHPMFLTGDYYEIVDGKNIRDRRRTVQVNCEYDTYFDCEE